MTLALELKTASPSHSHHEGVQAEIRLSNKGSQAYQIPRPKDKGGALQFVLYDGEGIAIRRMSVLTGHAMKSGARLDTRPTLSTLAPGQEWKWNLDLSSLHYCVPAGDWSLGASYNFSPLRISLSSNQVSLPTKAQPITGMKSIREDSVLDGLALLISTGGPGKEEWYLRQHIYSRPLASWYSSKICEGITPEQIYMSRANFFQTDTFDPFFRKWVLWTRDGVIYAQSFVRGRAEGGQYQVALPSGRVPISSAFHTLEGRLFVFLREGDHALECHEFTAGGLKESFRKTLPSPSLEGAVLYSNKDGITLVRPGQGLHLSRMDFMGEMILEKEIVQTKRILRSCDVDPVSGSIKAVFQKPAPNGDFQMIYASTRDIDFQDKIIPDALMDEDAGEVVFDCDRRGRFHYLVTTAGKELYYCLEDRAPVVVASGVEKFFPRILVPRNVYVGFFDQEQGYRFGTLNRNREEEPVRFFDENRDL